jgi:hypothetical protein
MKMASQLLLFICLNILIGQVDYQTQIQTIFNSNCTSCHIDGGAYYGGLDLSTYNNVIVVLSLCQMIMQIVTYGKE